MSTPFDVVILAAGKGTRMRSRHPKVLHPLGGVPLLKHVLGVASMLSPARIVVVVGHGAEEVRAALSGCEVTFVDQGEPRGTGHALLAARDAVSAPLFLVLPGDVPLVPPQALQALLSHCGKGAILSFLTMEPLDPGSYGRVVREGGRPVRIVEAEEEMGIREVNSEIYCLANVPALWAALRGLSADNAQGEYRLADLVGALAEEGVVALRWPKCEELLGINDRGELAQAEAILRARIIGDLWAGGVTVVDPATAHVSPNVEVGLDTIIHPDTHLLGRTKVGEGCEIGPGAYLLDCEVEDGARVWYSVLWGARVAPGARIGPFAHLRPGAVIGAQARVGNFVEVKAAVLGEGVRAGHLAYIGDAEVGPGANIGAGTITCNYDGRKKYRTDIGPGAFIGSNASLVAPVRIGEGAYVAAGSVITQDVPPYALAIGRSPQTVKQDWAKERKKE